MRVSRSLLQFSIKGNGIPSPNLHAVPLRKDLLAETRVNTIAPSVGRARTGARAIHRCRNPLRARRMAAEMSRTTRRNIQYQGGNDESTSQLARCSVDAHGLYQQQPPLGARKDHRGRTSELRRRNDGGMPGWHPAAVRVIGKTVCLDGGVVRLGALAAQPVGRLLFLEAPHLGP